MHAQGATVAEIQNEIDRKFGNNYLDMVCYDLNDVFTAELAENAENKHIFIMSLRILPLRALRSRA
jgi:hypothetical protein